MRRTIDCSAMHRANNRTRCEALKCAIQYLHTIHMQSRIAYQAQSRRGRRPVHSAQPSSNRRFQCSTCGQWFRDKYNLSHHAIVHTGEKPYKCPICERAFSRINLRRQHIEMEHGEESEHFSLPYSYFQASKLRLRCNAAHARRACRRNMQV